MKAEACRLQTLNLKVELVSKLSIAGDLGLTGFTEETVVLVLSTTRSNRICKAASPEVATLNKTVLSNQREKSR